ncbi:MAG: [protein-PII] uridylyltransferase [Gammaproteobacteria bacterium]|nr:[protein-PII] uridylyltransferase [Gammaproteobacteria bacterium]
MVKLAISTIDKELFNSIQFDNELNQSKNHLLLFKQTLKQAQTSLFEFYHAGRSASELVHAWARFIDKLLQRAWDQHLNDNGQLSLLAVGGYGRGELHPHSDIDLMILLPEDNHEFDDQLEHFLRFLWDIGLEVGHSVRTLDECVSESEKDITVATNIQEARLISGNPTLLEEQRKRCSPQNIWPSKEFFAAKWKEQISRHAKFNDTSYNLEPNIKEGPGGLRDIQMIGWVAKRHFDANTLHDLVTHHFLSETEYNSLIGGQNFLWKIRFGLHVLTKRREDRLLFDHQRTLAKQFGYVDEPHRLGVESFMKDYYRTIMELNRLNEMLLQLFQEEILHTEDEDEPVLLNKRFQVRKGFLEICYSNTFKRYPFALLELFLILTQNPNIKGVRANTIRAIREHRHLIDNDFRNDLRCKSLFMEILRQPTGVTQELRRMNRYGILAAYIPAFGKIVGQMQHDLFHVYTVDEHTLTVIRNLRRFTVEEYTNEFPLCSELIAKVPKQELLIITALFHDIAKGRGGDHSTLGAVDVEEFCKLHGLGKYDTDIVSWLVKNHLIMSATAQRKDISDPGVVHNFASQVGDLIHLNYIYLLTVADIRATSPDVWNTWKDALLKELYHATRKALQRGLDNPLVQTELIDDIKKQASNQISILKKKDLHTLWQGFNEEYFLRYSVDEIVWQSKALLSKKAKPPMVLIRKKSERGGTEVFIYSKIFDGLFAISTSVIDQLGFTIMDARIMQSRDNYTLNSYIILDQEGDPVSDDYRLEELRSRIHELILNPIDLKTDSKPHLNRQQKQFTFPTEVDFWADPNYDRTVMKVTAYDRPGLLSLVSTAMNQCQVRLHNAKVATFGERAEDLFFVTDHNNKPLTTSDQFSCLRSTITKYLDD